MSGLNYRAFEATIILKSYKDRLIDVFDAPALFDRMYEDADEGEMLRCGEGIAFKKGISIKGCHCKCLPNFLMK